MSGSSGSFFSIFFFPPFCTTILKPNLESGKGKGKKGEKKQNIESINLSHSQLYTGTMAVKGIVSRYIFFPPQCAKAQSSRNGHSTLYSTKSTELPI